MDIWHFINLAGILTMVLVIGLKIQRKILIVPWLYFCGLSAWASFALFMGATTPFELSLKYSAAKALATFVLFPLFFASLNQITVRALRRAIYLLLAVDAVWLMVGGGGLMVGYTQDTIVMAFLLPLLWVDKVFRWLIPIYLACIAWSFGKGAFIIICAEVVAISFFYTRSKLAAWVGVCLGLAGIVASTKYMVGTRWTVVWKEHLTWWGANANQWIGAGPGSFEWVSKLAIPVHTEGPKMWLHGDWLQIMFEYGLIGLALSVALYMYVFIKLFRARHGFAFASWVGVGLSMCVYSPIQFWFVQILVGMMIVHATNIEKVPVGYPQKPKGAPLPVPKAEVRA